MKKHEVRAKPSMRKIYQLGPFRITRENLIRLIIADVLAVVALLLSAVWVFAAQMSQGGSFTTSSDLSTYWTAVDVTPGVTSTWDAAGYSGGCVQLATPVGRNAAGNRYIYQMTTGTIQPTDAVTLTFRWKKNYSAAAPSTHTLYMEIQKPSATVVRIWEDLTASSANTWTLFDQTYEGGTSPFSESGVYQIRFGADLKNGNNGSAQTFGWFDEVSLDATGTGDTTPPTVTITDPTSGAFVKGTYTISADAADNVAINRVEFYNDTTSLIGTDNTGPTPYTMAWNTIGVSDGSHALTAKAFDTATNSTTSTAINVTVDNTNPTSTITDPIASQLIPETSYAIIGTANDTNFLQYTLQYGAGSAPSAWNDIGTNPRTTPVTAGTLGTWDTVPLSDGIYTIRLITTDRASNSTTSTVLVTVDSTKPTVVSANSASSILVDVLFSEDIDASSILSGYFTIDNGLSVSGASLQADNRTVRLTTSTQTGGLAYTVTVKNTAPTVQDIAGNIVGTPNTAGFTGYVVDTTTPSVSITDPTSGAFIRGSYLIVANATDNVGVTRVEFYYNGGNLIGTDNTPPTPFSISWDTTAIGNGTYSLTAKAYDNATNSTTSAAIDVTVDNTLPTSIITSPADSQLIPETSFAILGTASDANFTQYTLQYGAGSSPSVWNDIGTNPRLTPVTSGTLGTWNTAPLSDGIYTIRLITTDAANNSTTAAVTVNVDSTLPTVVSAAAASSTLVDVLFSENLNAATIDSSYFTINNGLTVSGAVLQADNQTVRLGTNNQVNGAGYTVTVSNAAPTVEDVAGNIVGSLNSVSFTGYAAPTSIITAPATDQLVKGSVTITGTASDPNFTQYVLDVAKGKLATSGFKDIGTNPRVVPVTNGTLGTWDTSTLSDGDYTIRLTTANSLAQETVTTVRVVLDDTPPAVESARAVDSTTVDLLFREHIGATLDPAYFSIPGLTVSAAQRLEDNRTVRLTTSAQTADANYTITVRSTLPTVADKNGNNIISANNTAAFTGYNTSTIRGDGRLLRRHNDDPTCGGPMMGCHNLLVHSSDISRNNYGTWGRTFNCLTCHTPHETKNIYVIKPTITTPNSGDKTVDLRNLGIGDTYNDPYPADPTNDDPIVGAHDYSLGDATDNFNDSVCEVCHTQTSHFRNVDSQTPSPNHNNDKNCTNSACHPHTLGFPYPAEGESSGGNSCDSCHSDLFASMNNDTTRYHHYLANTTPTYPVITDSTTLTATDSNKRCLMCHVDHNVFRPDLNGANGGQRAKNLRQTVKVDATTTSNFTNTDYASGLPDGGLCLSCHASSMTKNNTAQKDDGTTATLAINKTQFDAATTAHNYEVSSTFASDTSTFNGNCVKCHSDTLPKSYQGGTGNAFGVHLSWLDDILAALGISNASSADDPLEERLCYGCHKGGAAANGTDYYGVATMTRAAINIKDMFSKLSIHPVGSTSGKHKPTEATTLGWNQGTNRHVECMDCHNPHAAQSGLHTTGSNIIGASLLGQWGVKPTSWLAAGTQHTSFTIVNLTATSGDQLQAYLCFKCHSFYAYQNNPPNTPSGMPDGTAAVQTDVVTEFNPNNLAHHAVIQPGKHPTTNPNFAQTFVPPWSPTSTVSCSDCHSSDSSSDPKGPHGSNNKWLLRSNETGVGTAVVFCYNCHRRDVYGDDGYSPTSPTLSRVSHPINNNHSGTPPKNGIWCMNCHGGSVLGGMHGTNAGVGTAGGTDPMGERFLNGAAILGITRATTSNGSGGCWTKGTADAVNNCTRGHSDMGWTANYNL
jgi:hypothetical protein